MDKEFFMQIALPIIGLVVFVCTLAWGRNLNRQPVELAFEKLGLAFKADALTLVLLLAFGLIGAGAFQWYQGYETKFSDMEKKIQTLRERAGNMEEVLSEFKEFNLRFFLVFPEHDKPEDVFETDVNAFILRRGERNPTPYELIDVDKGHGGITVEIQKLSYKDKVFVVARHGDKLWKSASMTMPAGHLKMVRRPYP